MNKIRKKLRLWKENPICFVCEKAIEEFSEATLEHIIPITFGGGNSDGNLAISHKFCNELKGSLTSENEWKKKLLEYEEFCQKVLWRRKRSDCYIRCLMKKSFGDFEFAQDSLHHVPPYYLITHIPKKDLKFQIQQINKLRKRQNINDLIEASKQIDKFKTQEYWKIIFGLLFVEKYLKTQDITAILHAIWRLSSFRNNQGSLILYSYSQYLLSLCESNEPTASLKLKTVRVT